MENKSTRRKFIRNLALVGGATSASGIIASGQPSSAWASIPVNADFHDALLMTRDNGIHLGVFYPTEDAITNPGMGVTGHVMSINAI